MPPAIETYPNPGELGIVVENLKTGKRSTVRLRRFRPNSTGYRLVLDVPSAFKEIETWTERRDDGRVDWHIRVDGSDHGGGAASSHAAAYQEAAHYLRDLEVREAEAALALHGQPRPADSPAARTTGETLCRAEARDER